MSAIKQENKAPYNVCVKKKLWEFFRLLISLPMLVWKLPQNGTSQANVLTLIHSDQLEEYFTAEALNGKCFITDYCFLQ